MVNSPAMYGPPNPNPYGAPAPEVYGPPNPNVYGPPSPHLPGTVLLRDGTPAFPYNGQYYPITWNGERWAFASDQPVPLANLPSGVPSAAPAPRNDATPGMDGTRSSAPVAGLDGIRTTRNDAQPGFDGIRSFSPLQVSVRNGVTPAAQALAASQPAAITINNPVTPNPAPTMTAPAAPAPAPSGPVNVPVGTSYNDWLLAMQTSPDAAQRQQGFAGTSQGLTNGPPVQQGQVALSAPMPPTPPPAASPAPTAPSTQGPATYGPGQAAGDRVEFYRQLLAGDVPAYAEGGVVNGIVGEGRDRTGFRGELVIKPRAIQSGDVTYVEQPTGAELEGGSFVAPLPAHLEDDARETFGRLQGVPLAPDGKGFVDAGGQRYASGGSVEPFSDPFNGPAPGVDPYYEVLMGPRVSGEGRINGAPAPGYYYNYETGQYERIPVAPPLAPTPAGPIDPYQGLGGAPRYGNLNQLAAAMPGQRERLDQQLKAAGMLGGVADLEARMKQAAPGVSGLPVFA